MHLTLMESQKSEEFCIHGDLVSSIHLAKRSSCWFAVSASWSRSLVNERGGVSRMGGMAAFSAEAGGVSLVAGPSAACGAET